MQKSLIDQTDGSAPPRSGRNMSAAAAIDENNSTLIEFPGMSRAVPAWRKQLSQRVREIQEQRAREAAEAEAATRAAESVSCALPSGQLELVPDREQAPMNPIVTKALERVDRARRGETQSGGFAAATAVAPAFEPEPEETQAPELSEPTPEEIKPKLTIVASVVKEEAQSKPKPVRLITDSIDDSALSYLENCLSITDTERVITEPSSFVRRSVAAIFDLVIVALFVTPSVAIVELMGGDWNDLRNAGIVAGVSFGVLLVYHTVAIALTGRTIAMRMFSLRVIDLRTRMIPTGGQALKRALAYIFSLLLGGLGVIYALIDRDGRTVHDRFSKSIVIRG